MVFALTIALNAFQTNEQKRTFLCHFHVQCAALSEKWSYFILWMRFVWMHFAKIVSNHTS